MNKQPEALQLADRIDLKDYYEFDASLHCPKAAAELRRLHSVEKAFQQWITKTEWVQKSSQSHELGMHRADVMKQRLEQILIENQQLRAALSQLQAKQDQLTNEQIDAIADAMPGGLEGFLRGWGWRQFARAVLESANNTK